MVFLFIIFLSCFVDIWSLEVTFSMILVSLGRLWTCLVPGGSREATLSKYTAQLVHFLLNFGVICWSKMVMILRCFFRWFFGWMFMDFEWFWNTFGRFVDNCFVFFFEIVNM